MPTLRISSRTQIYADTIPGQVAEPFQRYCDQERFLSGVSAREVISDLRVVDPGTTLTLATVANITGVAAGALYSLKAHPTKAGRYQVRYVSGAVTPQLAGLGAGLVTPANTYVISLNTDGTINLQDTSTVPVNFGVSRGDEIYIAGASFGDTGPFSVENQGYWNVVSCSAVGVNPGVKLVLQRVDLTDTVGVAETVTATAALNVQKVTAVASVLLAGAPPYAGIWTVTESAAGWFAVDSLNTLPDLLGQTLTACTIATEQILAYARVEADGLAIVSSKSGDLIQGQQIIRPVRFVDPLTSAVNGWCEIYGFLTSLTVQNVTDVPVNVNVILAYSEF